MATFIDGTIMLLVAEDRIIVGTTKKKQRGKRLRLCVLRHPPSSGGVRSAPSDGLNFEIRARPSHPSSIIIITHHILLDLPPTLRRP